jgi:hypothetical protein
LLPKKAWKCMCTMLRNHSVYCRQTVLISKSTCPVLFTSASCLAAMNSTLMAHARSSRSPLSDGRVDAELVLHELKSVSFRFRADVRYDSWPPTCALCGVSLRKKKDVRAHIIIDAVLTPRETWR